MLGKRKSLPGNGSPRHRAPSWVRSPDDTAPCRRPRSRITPRGKGHKLETFAPRMAAEIADVRTVTRTARPRGCVPITLTASGSTARDSVPGPFRRVVTGESGHYVCERKLQSDHPSYLSPPQGSLQLRLVNVESNGQAPGPSQDNRPKPALQSEAVPAPCVCPVRVPIGGPCSLPPSTGVDFWNIPNKLRACHFHPRTRFPRRGLL